MITIISTDKSVSITNGSEILKGELGEFQLFRSGNYVLVTQNGIERFREVLSQISINETDLTNDNYQSLTESIFGGGESSSEVTIIDTAKTEAPATAATGDLTWGQLLRGILSTLMSKMSALIGGRSLVENLGRPTTARQLALVANTVNDVTLTANIRRISIYATVDSFYLIGTSAQTPTLTTGHFIAGGERLDLLLNDNSTPHIAFISASAGFVYVSELTTPAA
jgi:hypothetical protein